MAVEVQSTWEDASYEIGWWPEDGGKLASSSIHSLSMQLRHYLANGYGYPNNTVLLFGYSNQAAVGLYIGKGLQNEGVGSFALKALGDSVLEPEVKTSSVAMQLCHAGYDADHIFGFIATSNGSFTPIQRALRTWARAECLSITKSKNITGPAYFTTPPLGLAIDSALRGSNATTTTSARNDLERLSARADGRTNRVQTGESCGSLAKKCGIADADIIKHNSASNFNSVTPGTLPHFKPEPNPDGSCYTHTFQAGDSCSSVAAANGLTNDDLEDFNKKTWAWNGCSNVWVGTIACLSRGRPPFPAPIANAVCGPQVPGTKVPTGDSDIASLNPCPLNACCNFWGQCGTTEEFCINTGTGVAGTTGPGTNGCISNCGASIINGKPHESFKKLGYFKGYNFSSHSSVYQNTLQDEASQYTHLHFAFGSITPDYEINTGDTVTTDEFNSFKLIKGPKRILSFGSRTISNDPGPYTIICEGVTDANRLKLATNIANFIKKHGLDGVNIDLEYPSAPNLPAIQSRSKDEGENYLAFLVLLKDLLRERSVSIAAPASYQYLKGFPMDRIGEIVDYMVYMTFDLHGQVSIPIPSPWKLITKAGVPSNKVVVSMPSYGISFAMAATGCHTPDCLCTGGPQSSNAAKDVCAQTARYIANAEIEEILKDPGRINQHYIDGASNSNILVYDNTQWICYLSAEVKESRTALFNSLNMGGTADWAIDSASYHNRPANAGGWSNFLQKRRPGEDPYGVEKRTGNWTELTCEDPGAADRSSLPPSQRWGSLDCNHAWQDAINIWKTVDKPRSSGENKAFLASISITFSGPEGTDCGKLYDASCENTRTCDTFHGKDTGPAAFLIWNSLVMVHNSYRIQLTDAKLPMQMYNDIDKNLQRATSDLVNSVFDFTDKFLPTLPADNKWLLAMIDHLLPIGTAAIGGFVFHSWKPTRDDELKTTTSLLIGQSTTLAANLLDTRKIDWSTATQDEFSNYLGETIYAWVNITAVTLRDLFNGSDASIATLTGIISDGKLIDGRKDNQDDVSVLNTRADAPMYDAGIARIVFGFAIPSIWTAAGTFPFVIDSGYPCGTIDPLDSFLSVETMHATASCVDDKLYYLASPKGDAREYVPYPRGSGGYYRNNKFSAPPGVEFLNHGNSFKGVTLDDIVKGAVHTYKQNGGRNGGKVADPGDAGTRKRLTNGGSPLVSDCMTIIKNIEGTDGQWTTPVVGKSQRRLVDFGTCKFGVEATKVDGNIAFYVGAQDIVDIITDAIKQFAKDGRVAAKGDMSCRGNVHGQNVKWGIY
ncbi:class V chitinase, putative [Trichophyton verrucosum HKI 0517]|uniref:chitinase n=1 Tax=Trichophyton verrucosum (strain HKI 0517) TaxID=663202 RepID=D4D1Q4_TRIVH|nr:class V chitinase, putative [Trichophyton verrucosum HKI 0517]EFE44221.1 class V chitinase, putative [Trichophyton verrucosum HKI 0517]